MPSHDFNLRRKHVFSEGRSFGTKDRYQAEQGTVQIPQVGRPGEGNYPISDAGRRDLCEGVESGIGS